MNCREIEFGNYTICEYYAKPFTFVNSIGEVEICDHELPMLWVVKTNNDYLNQLINEFYDHHQSHDSDDISFKYKGKNITIDITLGYDDPVPHWFACVLHMFMISVITYKLTYIGKKLARTQASMLACWLT